MTRTKIILLLLGCGLFYSLNGCAGKQHEKTALVPKEPSKNMVCKPFAQATQFHAGAPAPAATGGVQPATVLAPASANGPLPNGTGVGSASQKQVESNRFSPLQSVHFAFDSYLLDDAARDALEQFYQRAKTDNSTYVLEGFCDERGDDAYNVALGEHRSKSVLRYLVNRGIEAKRLKFMSYGLEYPVVSGHNEEAWRLNRRVEIVENGAPQPGSIRRYGQE